MAFDNGVFSAPELNPNPSGLFSIIKPETYSATPSEERWVRGYAQEFIAEPSAIKNIDDTDTTSEEIYAAGGKPERYIDVKPFFIEVEDTDSTFGLVYDDRFERVLAQLEAVTQKAVETELWAGAIAQGESNGNPYLRKASTVTTLASGAALSAERCLGLIEHEARRRSPVGEEPVIHMTADVASILGTKIQFDKKNDQLVTRLGSKVVIGAGFSGDGPVGDSGTSASNDNKWIYATGNVSVHLGAPEVVNDSLAQGYDVSGNQNDMRIKAFRSASVHFDTSIHIAARVDLTA